MNCVCVCVCVCVLLALSWASRLSLMASWAHGSWMASWVLAWVGGGGSEEEGRTEGLRPLECGVAGVVPLRVWGTATAHRVA